MNTSETPAPAAAEESTATSGDDAAMPTTPTAAESDRPAPTAAEGAATLAGWALVACLLTLLNTFAGLLIRVPPYGTLAGHLLAILFLALLLGALLNAARAAARLPFSAPFLLIVGLALGWPALLTIFSGLSPAVARSAGLVLGFLPFPVAFVLRNLVAPIGMTLIGAGIGRLRFLQHPNTLLVASGVSLFFDIVVVTMGTVAQLMKTSAGAAVIAAASVGAGGGATPTAGRGAPPVKPPDPISGVTIGPADVLFLALFLSAVYALRLSTRATYAWMFALLMAALILVETTGLPVPALVPMGIAVLIANARHAAFTAREKRDLKIGAVFAVFCAALIVVGARRAITAAPGVATDEGPVIGFRLGLAPQTGVFAVMAVEPGSRADRQGLRPGDAVLAINGRPPGEIPPEEFGRLLRRAGRDGITLRIKSGDQPAPREVVFPATAAAASPSPSPSAAPKTR